MGMKPMFPTWPVHSRAEEDAVLALMRSGRTNQWTGDAVQRFEQAFSAMHDGAPMAAVANGSLALEAALHAVGVGQGDQVLVPCRGFVATAMAVVRLGARPIFVDVDPVSGLAQAEQFDARWQPGVCAAIAVHLAGWPVNMNDLVDWAGHRGVQVVEDVAQAHGATWGGRLVGTFGQAAAWSFCQDKIITTGGEGGMVRADNLDAVRALRDHGRVQAAAGRHVDFVFSRTSIGTNLRLSGVQAAIGAAQCDALQDWLGQRRENAAVLRERLDGRHGITVPWPAGGAATAWYRCMVHVPAHLRTRLLERMPRCFGATVGPCPDMRGEPALQQFNDDYATPGAAQCGATSVALPVHPTAGEQDMHDMADAVERTLGHTPRRMMPQVRTAELKDRHVAVTGGAGSIGSALIEQLLAAGAGTVVAIDRAEASLQVLQRRTQSDKRVHCVLLDVRSTAALTATLKAHGITDVVHTAAHKHVPIVEANPVEGVRNNVFGTKAVVDAAAAAKVSRLVFCSTDKAVDPVGVMGMTKRLGEALVLDGRVPAVVLRCCNVEESSGSVAEVFREHLLAGEALTITDPAAARWFTSMRNICDRLVQALQMEPHAIVVPAVGNARSIKDLAAGIARARGMHVVPPAVTGLRPGERVIETALTTGVSRPTRFEGLLQVDEAAPRRPDLGCLERLCGQGDAGALRAALQEMTAPVPVDSVHA